MRPAIKRLLDANQLRLLLLLAELSVHIVVFDEFADIDPEARTLRNVNTPEEYRRAVEEATGEEFKIQDSRFKEGR